MSLTILGPSNIDNFHTHPWDKIRHPTDEDICLATELGLIDGNIPNDEIDYLKMIENEENKLIEEFHDIEEFIQEGMRSYLSNTNELWVDTRELIPINTPYKGAYIRVKMIKKNLILASISNLSDINVYIPPSLSRYITLGEIIKVDLIYNPNNDKNIWKVVYIYPKEDPSQTIYHDHGNYIISEVSIPKQNIGSIVGYKGKYINTIAKSLLHNNPNMKQIMGTSKIDKFPQLDIKNKGNKTIIRSFHQPNTYHHAEYDYDFIRDVVMKLYA